MQTSTPTVQDPRPAARVGYHMGIGLATTFAWAECRDFGGLCADVFRGACLGNEKPAGGGSGGLFGVRS